MLAVWVVKNWSGLQEIYGDLIGPLTFFVENILNHTSVFFWKQTLPFLKIRSLQQNTLWNLLLLINCSNTCSSKVFVCQEDSGCSRIVRLMEMFHTDIILVISFWKIQFSEFSEFSESLKKFQNFAKLDYAINWQLSFIQWHFENSLKSWTRQITPCSSM